MSKNGQRVTVTTSVEAYSRAAVSRRYSQGIHYWEMSVFGNRNGNVMIGTTIDRTRFFLLRLIENFSVQV